MLAKVGGTIGHEKRIFRVLIKRPEALSIVLDMNHRDFDDLFASDPCVLYQDGRWVMFYYGYSSDTHARDGFATSPDLKSWTKSGEILIDVGTPGSLDDKYAAKPAMITANGVLFHFYNAVTQFERRSVGEIQHTEVRGIAYATSIKYPSSTTTGNDL